MLKKSTFVILIILLYFKGNSQFIVQNWEQNKSDYFHTLLPQTKANEFQYLVLKDIQHLTSYIEPAQIFKYNFSGQLIDSINLPKGLEPFSYPAKKNNNYYWASIYTDTTSLNSNITGVYLMKFDTLFNCVQKVLITSIDYEFKSPSNILSINNNLFLTLKYTNSNKLKLLKYDINLNLLDSASANGALFATWLEKTNSDKIMISGLGFPAPPSNIGQQKIIIDTMLNLINVFTLDSLTYVTAGGSVLTGCSSQIGINNLFFKILPISDTKNYIIGTYDVPFKSDCSSHVNIVHSIIDNSNHILNTTLIADSTRDIRYADGINYAIKQNNSIYTVASEGYFGWLLENNNTSILVTKSDTMANLIWKKRYGDDMFYRPVSIIQTLDSGFLISGVRYDHHYTSYTGVAQGFILRLDKNGDLVSTGIKEQGSKNFISFSCFPNPTKDVVYFDVFLTSNYQLEIFDILGKSVYQDKNYQNKSAVSIEFLNTGQYIYKLKTKESFFTGKIIKE